MLFPNLKTTLIASSIALLCACNSEIDSFNKEQPHKDRDHDHTQITSKGRLAISHAETANVSVFDADDNTLLEMFNTSSTVSALYASPHYRFAIAVQRADNFVEFIDGGLFRENHGDHLHDYKETPTLSGFTLTNSKPTHFDISAQQAALFFDGDIDTGIPASFVILSDESIEQEKILASHRFDNAMHGTAQIRGDSVITTFRSLDTTSVLPNYVEQLHIHGDHFHQEQRFELDCPALHGSAQNHDYVAFGCGDGVLIINQQGNSFSATKIANLDSFAQGTRIGSLRGSEHSELFLGIAKGKEFYTIDPKNAVLTALPWQQNTDNTVIASTLNRLSGEFYVLESDGYLSVLHAEDDWQVNTRFKVFENPQGRYSLSPSVADNTLYISDKDNKTVLSINPSEQTSEVILTLDFTPQQITWLGIKSESDHEHAH